MSKKTTTKKTRKKTTPKRPSVINLSFDDNHLAQALFGAHHANLAQIENALGVTIKARGGEVEITGDAMETARAALLGAYDQLQRGRDVGENEIAAALSMTSGAGHKAFDPGMEIHTKKRVIAPRTPGQAKYLSAIDDNEMVFCIGPAGTGKTYLAVAKAVERLISGTVDRIILSRPAVEAGEQLGFLPGDMQEKVDPYLRPLYDALYDMLPADQVERRLENGEIEVAPLAFMRGRTLANAFVILDEAQNTSAVQMKMFLTRLGEHAKMAVTGDLTQVDLPKGMRSGLRDATEILAGVKGIGFIEFSAADVVRHPLVTRIVTAYDKVEARRHEAAPYEYPTKKTDS